MVSVFGILCFLIQQVSIKYLVYFKNSFKFWESSSEQYRKSIYSHGVYDLMGREEKEETI